MFIFFATDENFQDLTMTFQQWFKNKFRKLLAINRLTIIYEKTVAAVFSSIKVGSQTNLQMKNHQVDCVDSKKFLGIVINKRWSFDDQSSYISIIKFLKVGKVHKLSTIPPENELYCL